MSKHKLTLDQDAKKRLANARRIADGDLKKVREAVWQALVGVPPGAGYKNLKNVLERRLRESIRGTNAKKKQSCIPVAGLMLKT